MQNWETMFFIKKVFLFIYLFICSETFNPPHPRYIFKSYVYHEISTFNKKKYIYNVKVNSPIDKYILHVVSHHVLNYQLIFTFLQFQPVHNTPV